METISRHYSSRTIHQINYLTCFLQYAPNTRYTHVRKSIFHISILKLIITCFMIRLSLAKTTNTTNKQSQQTNNANKAIKAYDTARSKSTKSLWYSDTTSVHLNFYIKTFSDLQQKQRTKPTNQQCQREQQCKLGNQPTMNTMFQSRKLLRF